jgi:hypothetical protein
MTSKLLFLALLAATICSARAEIDLTPTVREYTSAGFVYHQVKLKQPTQDILFVLPQGWSIRGGKDRLQLQPADKNFVEAIVTATPLAAPQPFDEPTVQALEQQVLAETPPGSQAAQVVRRGENPVALGPNPSLEVVISYTTLGRTFCRSVIFVHTADTQIVFRFTAPKEDFTALNLVFRRSINSWQWIETSPSVKVAQKDGSQAVVSRQ